MRVPRSGCETREREGNGFSIVELLVAVIILAFGVLGMAGSTMYVVRQVTAAELQTDRTAARQMGLERVRAVHFDTLMARGDGSDTIQGFVVDWQITTQSANWAEVDVITTGPGVAGSAGGMATISQSVTDTFSITVIN